MVAAYYKLRAGICIKNEGYDENFPPQIPGDFLKRKHLLYIDVL